jgi:hypothetical protein
MKLTVLSVAYPLATVGIDAVGGAEQILSQLDYSLTLAGHHSIVVAAEGSRVVGTLVPVSCPSGPLDKHTLAAAQERHRRAILAALERWPVDLVHLHGIDFHAYLPPPGVPVLVTLHMPVAWYAPDVLQPTRPKTWLHCVSKWQHASCPQTPALLEPIENGVGIAEPAPHAKRRFALTLSRICPEKGIHIAIDAARRVDIPLLIAGAVFDYADHRNYFEHEIKPRLDRWRRFIGPVGPARKRRLLAAARCLVVSSLMPETSSLAAREALAVGTPVVAFGKGALAETIEYGRTGFLVWNEIELAQAMLDAAKLDPQACRARARERFSLARMISEYFSVYERLTEFQQPAACVA